MSRAEPDLQTIRDLLAPFGPLRPQAASDWTGPMDLPASLARFFAEVGPWGEDGPTGPEGLSVPGPGNPVQLPPLRHLWDLQAGYRWDGRSGAALVDWPDEWLVVGDAGGDPLILDRNTGAIFFARHGQGRWNPEPLCADIFALALVLGTMGRVHAEAADQLYDAEFEVRPEWRARLREALAPILGAAAADPVATHLGW